MFMLTGTIIFYLYLVFLLIFAVFLLANFLHLINTGTFTVASSIATLLVVGFAAAVIITTFSILQGLDLRDPIFVFSDQATSPADF